MRGRRIAFDYGQSRIGVAICDPDGILATPLPHLDAKHPRLLKEIATLFAEYEPIKIFLGRPKHLSGVEGDAVAHVEAFKESLAAITNVEVIFVDERFTTVDAQRKLHESGKNAKESRALIDSMAAVSILESGLAHEAR
jgi:putative Holliday junction resolvase